MDLDAALAATTIDRGPRSHLEKLIEHLAGDPRLDKIMAALTGTAEAQHLGRALTLIARADGVIAKDSSISGQSIQKWRAAR